MKNLIINNIAGIYFVFVCIVLGVVAYFNTY